MSRQVEERLVKILPTTHTSPYGNPIPGLEDLGLATESGPQTRALTDVVAQNKDVKVKIQWLGEPLQVDTFLLGQFKRTGVMPDAVASLRLNGEYLTLSVEGEPEVLDLPPETADNVFVTVV